MSLTGAFNTGVSGLIAYSSAMSALSDDFANLRSAGYKRLQTDFSDLLGGINVRETQPGGVQATSRRLADVQGPIETTGLQFDMAIGGAGFFVFGNSPEVGGGGDLSFSRDGQLSTRTPSLTDQRGFLANNAGKFLMAFPASLSGQIETSDLSKLQPVQLTDIDEFAGVKTNTATLVASIPPNETTVQTLVDYVDDTGALRSAQLLWTKQDVNTWKLDVKDETGAPLAAPFTMTFDGTGKLTSSSTLDIGGHFSLEVGDVAQRGTLFIRSDYHQDGLESGQFVRHEITQDGTILGHFSNGAIRTLYRVPVATFINPNALTAVSNTMFQQSAESGGPQLRGPGDDLVHLIPNAVEQSNVDISDGFTQMIITQRAYSSSAQVVRTIDEMTMVVRDLKR